MAVSRYQACNAKIFDAAGQLIGRCCLGRRHMIDCQPAEADCLLFSNP